MFLERWNLDRKKREYLGKKQARVKGRPAAHLLRAFVLTTTNWPEYKGFVQGQVKN